MEEEVRRLRKETKDWNESCIEEEENEEEDMTILENAYKPTEDDLL